MGGGARKKGKIKECKGKSEIATAAKTRLVTDDKKMLSSHRVPDGGALLIPRFFILFLPGGEKNGKRKVIKMLICFLTAAPENKKNSL